MKKCWRCGREDVPVGPWRGRGGYPTLCGACKAELTLTPAAVKRLEEDLRAALSTADVEINPDLDSDPGVD